MTLQSNVCVLQSMKNPSLGHDQKSQQCKLHCTPCRRIASHHKNIITPRNIRIASLSFTPCRRDHMTLRRATPTQVGSGYMRARGDTFTELKPKYNRKAFSYSFDHKSNRCISSHYNLTQQVKLQSSKQAVSY